MALWGASCGDAVPIRECEAQCDAAVTVRPDVDVLAFKDALEVTPDAAMIEDAGMDRDSQLEVPVDPTCLTKEIPEDRVSIARAISHYCWEVDCWKKEHRLLRDEWLLLYEAAEIETGVPAKLMKAMIYHEAYGGLHADGVPRQFVHRDLAPGFGESFFSLGQDKLGLDIPILVGDDTKIGGDSYGLGVSQITASIDAILAALEVEGGAKQIFGGGRPFCGYEGPRVYMDVMRAIRDPYYNLLQAFRLLEHKRLIGSDDRPGNPSYKSWIKRNPTTDEEWALIGSTYQTLGGIGPGGGATERILNTMQDRGKHSAQFVYGTANLSKIDASRFNQALSCSMRKPPARSCESLVLDRSVSSGTCVQRGVDGCGIATCRWERCEDGLWETVDPAECADDAIVSDRCD